MDVSILSRGFLLGLAIAAPVGPIGVLVIRRSLSEGALVGLATGLGAAAADATYAAIAAFGVTAGASALTASRVFHYASAALLVYLAVQTLRAPLATAEGAPAARARTYARAFASTAVLTLANPATILSFAAASTATGLGASSTRSDALGFATSVLAGSATWWLGLSTATGLLGDRLGPRALRGVRLVAGTTLLVFAAMALR